MIFQYTLFVFSVVEFLRLSVFSSAAPISRQAFLFVILGELCVMSAFPLLEVLNPLRIVFKGYSRILVDVFDNNACLHPQANSSKYEIHPPTHHMFSAFPTSLHELRSQTDEEIVNAHEIDNVAEYDKSLEKQSSDNDSDAELKEAIHISKTISTFNRNKKRYKGRHPYSQ